MDPSSRGFQLLSLARKKFREKTSKSNHHPPTQNRLLSDDKVRKWLQRSKLSCHQEDIDSLLPEESIKGVMIHEQQKTSSKMLKNKECVKQRNGVNDVVTRECNERKDESSVHGGEQPMILNQAEQNTSIAQPITLPEVESGDTSADQVISPLVAESGEEPIIQNLDEQNKSAAQFSSPPVAESERSFTRWKAVDAFYVVQEFRSFIIDKSNSGARGSLPSKKAVQAFLKKTPILEGLAEKDKIKDIKTKIFNERQKQRNKKNL